MADRRPRRRSRGSGLRALHAGLLFGSVAVVCLALAAGEVAGPVVPDANAVPVVNEAAHSWLPGGVFAGAGGFVSRWFGRDGFLRGPGRHGPGHDPRPTGSPVVTSTTSGGVPTTPTTSPAVPPTTASTPPAAPPPATTDPNPNCTLIVPPAPLSAAGLATPYRFAATDPAAGACHETNSDQSAFVEATILDPDTVAASVYHPLVIDNGTQPAIAPVQPSLPRGAVVGVWFGYQADVLTLRSRRARHGVMSLRYNAGDGCVNGTPRSPFGQFAFCGAPRFFAAANAAIRAGKLVIPPLGTGVDGQPCPTTRDFAVVDQDQSDNLVTKYLALPDGRTAQFSAANVAALHGASTLTNASDNGLVDRLLDPVLGCHPFTAPDLSAAGAPSAALALNELQAAANQAAPIALVPPNDPMAEIDGATDVAKTNLYRIGVNQPRVNPATDTGKAYCTNLAEVAPPRLALDKKFTSAAPSPNPAVASSLFGFLTDRLTATWTNLGCETLTGHGPPTVDAATTTSAPATPTSTPVVSETATTTAPTAVPITSARPTTTTPTPATPTPAAATTPPTVLPRSTPVGDPATTTTRYPAPPVRHARANG